jgi:hypothetical protein
MKPIKRTAEFNSHFKARISRNDKLTAAFHESVASFLIDPASGGISKIRAKMAHKKRVYDDLEAIFSNSEPYLPGKSRSRH